MSIVASFFSSGFGAGYSPVAPGTFGSIVGVLLLYVLQFYGFSFGIDLLVFIFVFTLAAYAAIKYLPDTWSHDDQRIVSDEIVGMCVTLLFVPWSWKNVLVGLVLFRLFDITKPLGIRLIDRWKNDWGVLIDDLVAGVYANICLRMIIQYL